MVINIFGEIGWDVTAKDVMSQIQTCEDESIELIIASGGGSAFEGLMIYDALKASGKEIKTTIMGLGASAASVIFMAGDVREMGDGALLMIHNSWSMFVGNAEEVRDQLGTLEAIDERMTKIFVNGTGMAEDEIREMLSAETWLGVDEAKEKGFATGEAESLQIAASINNLYKNKKEPLSMAEEKQEEVASVDDQTLFAKFKAWWKSGEEPKAMDEEEPSEMDKLKAENEALKAEIEAMKENAEAAAEHAETVEEVAEFEAAAKSDKIFNAMSENKILLSEGKELVKQSLEEVEAALEKKGDNETGRGSEGEPKAAANVSHYDMYCSLSGAEKTAYFRAHKEEIIKQSKED
jgi:ATP-dependent Clp protease, protease subunit